MKHTLRRLPLLAVPALLAAPLPARALDPPASLVRLLAPRVESSGSVAVKSDALRQREIYRILCGGAEPQEAGLSEHLWRVAESLAGRDWEPPKVTIRVVVRELGRS